ncbi:glycerol-3-phosphate dehydrogenase C-terminal domain-containing protein [Massilia sp. Dwa41.01b]|uniref:glycerol-3-phosphate dehydrogenase C-terminal domain-containing protein n=1 Tax=Massilia sp. Dwa41.01b TaxID=2709302 RepID=UPI001E34721A|nr:glycerol-3-phosphate dehydrogenase C-terminal domain-containing protein [Massilia sp. Dwa41.01b]
MPGWTAQACLPGGDLFGAGPDKRGVLEFDAWRSRRASATAGCRRACSSVTRAYGTRIDTLLARCNGLADLREEVLPGLYAAEIDYLMAHEWARGAADILWRRTKLGLHGTGQRDAAGAVDGRAPGGDGGLTKGGPAPRWRQGAGDRIVARIGSTHPSALPHAPAFAAGGFTARGAPARRRSPAGARGAP